MASGSKLIQTYVFREDKAFFVSTINRDSSSMCGGRYAETMVWEWDVEKRERGAMVYQAEALEGSIRKHQEIVVRLHEGDDIGKGE